MTIKLPRFFFLAGIMLDFIAKQAFTFNENFFPWIYIITHDASCK